MDLQQIKQSLSLSDVISQHGVDLHRTGSNLVGLCPFHSENNPSFTVYTDSFYCFGCHESGDIFDFIMKLYSCDFKEALQRLGIEHSQISKRTSAEIKRHKAQRVAIVKFRQWEALASKQTGVLVRGLRKRVAKIRRPMDLDAYGDTYHDLSLYEYHHSILCMGSDEQKFSLFLEGRYADKTGRIFRQTVK